MRNTTLGRNKKRRKAKPNGLIGAKEPLPREKPLGVRGRRLQPDLAAFGANPKEPCAQELLSMACRPRCKRKAPCNPRSKSNRP